jgi:hypothetical protein
MMYRCTYVYTAYGCTNFEIIHWNLTLMAKSDAVQSRSAYTSGRLMEDTLHKVNWTVQ